MRKCMSAIFMVESQGNALYLRLQNFIVTKATANFRLPVCLKVTGDLKFGEVNVNMIEANKRTYDFIKTQKVHRKISTHY